MPDQPNTDQKLDALENRLSGLITTVDAVVATRADSSKEDEGERPDPTMAALADAVSTLTKQSGDFVKRDARRRRDEDTDSDKDDGDDPTRQRGEPRQTASDEDDKKLGENESTPQDFEIGVPEWQGRAQGAPGRCAAPPAG